MKYDEFLNFILSFGSSLFLENENMALLKKICSIVDKKTIHYLWSNYNSSKFVIQKKISCNQNEYHFTIEKIFTEDNYLMVIDSCCFTDNDRHIILKLNRSDLIEILTCFYWELDEIYILNNDLDWFIAINHNFEIVFYCNEDSTWLTYYRDKIMLIE